MDAIAFALGRRLTLIRGPPGTGKTRTAALLVASALRLRGWQPSEAEAKAEIEAEVEAEVEGGGESGAEGSLVAAEVLFARLQAISPGVQREDYYDAHGDSWDLEGLESDLKLANRVAVGAAAAASASAALGASATEDVLDGRGSTESEGESESEVGGGGESEGEGESEDAVAEGPLPPPRVLAVAHSNGAADVLLQALLRLGVPAVRAGRPAAVSPSVRRRTAVALAEQHPEVTPSPPRTHPHLPAHTPTCPYSPLTSPYTLLHTLTSGRAPLRGGWSSLTSGRAPPRGVAPSGGGAAGERSERVAVAAPASRRVCAGPRRVRRGATRHHEGRTRGGLELRGCGAAGRGGRHLQPRRP